MIWRNMSQLHRQRSNFASYNRALVATKTEYLCFYVCVDEVALNIVKQANKTHTNINRKIAANIASIPQKLQHGIERPESDILNRIDCVGGGQVSRYGNSHTKHMRSMCSKNTGSIYLKLNSKSTSFGVFELSNVYVVKLKQNFIRFAFEI